VGRWLNRQWFLLALVAVLACGGLLARSERAGQAANPVTVLADAKLVRQLVVAGVMFLMAWPLPSRELLRTLRAPWPALVATIINIGVVPLAAYPLAQLGHRDLGLGLLITAAIPCTLASAAVWTRRAGGNDATAILVTLITNASCFVVAPLWISVLTGRNLHGQLPILPMVGDLLLLVVAPLAAGQFLRFHAAAAAWATRHKWSLAVLAQVGILWMVFVGALQCGRQLFGLATHNTATGGWDAPTPGQLLTMIASVTGLHVGSFALGWMVAGRIGFGRADQIAVGIAGSQKTLMIGLQLAITHFGGYTMLPLVAYHVLQLLIDAVVADHLRQGERQLPRAAPATQRDEPDATIR
jgi:sodium/bile acid cotransporter 7